MSERRRFYAEIEAEVKDSPDAVADDIRDWITSRRAAGRVGPEPTTVRVSPKPLRELKGKRKDSDTAMIFSRKATRFRDAEDDE